MKSKALAQQQQPEEEQEEEIDPDSQPRMAAAPSQQRRRPQAQGAGLHDSQVALVIGSQTQAPPERLTVLVLSLLPPQLRKKKPRREEVLL